MITPFILFGGWLFWLLIVGIIIIETAFVEHEKGVLATIFLVFSVAMFISFSDIAILSWIAANALLVLYYTVGYFICGIVWFIFKWYLYLLDRREEAEEFKVGYMKKLGDKPFNKEDFVKDLIRYANYNDRYYPAKWKEHKADLIRWATYWPVSLAWSLLDDIVTRIWKAIFNYFGGLLQKITDHVFKDI